MLIHRSPALTAVYNEIRNSDRNRVLDLGPMSQGCFQLFSELSCKIQVENIAGAIREHLAHNSAIAAFDISQSLVAYPSEEKFDAILAWDLLNYLTLEQVQQLFEHLKPYCKPNTLVYLLRYVEKKIPAKPRDILVKDKYLLELSSEELVAREMPIYSTLQLLSAMPGYFMQDTLMGQMGMLPGVTEHVMRFTPSYESKHLISKSEASRSHAKESLHPQLTRKHHSPAVAEVMSLLHSSRELVVLDLGSSANRPEDAIVKTSESYYRVDLFSLIERSRAKNEDLLNLSVFSYELSRKFDVILAWDLFSYCTTKQLVQFDAMLAQLSHQNTFLLSFMYTGRNRPERPSRFEVAEGNHVLITPNAPNVAASETLTGVSLMRLLQAFNMDKTYAYRAGMDREIIEYIFASKSDASAQPLDATQFVIA